ncbi:MAG TPA: hypothetical protein PKD68_01580 [Candidatus Saccharibacteria bacterium]|nr:hypothetical protein [Candidatus Saccharibacteria bacterium]
MSAEQRSIDTIEATRGAGFTDWSRVARETGNTALAAALRKFDSEPGLHARNAHHFIHDRLTTLGLPIQNCVFTPLKNILQHPEHYFSTIPQGDYYFASIKPGTHLAHATTKEEVMRFMDHYASNASAHELSREVFISHNGEAVMSGHVTVSDDDEPNSLYGEFTVGNFNSFHRGFHTPEISVSRTLFGNKWLFRDALAARDNNWQTPEQFQCYGGNSMSRVDMAERITAALSCIPHDSNFLLPGYYEILFERVDETHTRPAFIEAIVDEP